jgi:hypothetical protein
MYLKKLIQICTTFTAIFMLASCTDSPTPITATNPLYMLVSVNQQLQLDIISRPSYKLAGTITIQQVGNYSPEGGIGVSRVGTVIVTYTGVVVGNNTTLAPATKTCSLQTGTCASLLDGWGSSMVSTAGKQVVVPIWNDAADLKGQIAYLSDDTQTIKKRIDVKSITPGFNVVKADDQTMYWLSNVSNGTGSSYELIRYDILRQKITATYKFGNEVPGSLAIAPDGSIYTPILYARQGTQSNKSTPQPGSWVEMFSPNLSPLGKFTVEQYPQQIAINTASGGSIIAIAYAPQGQPRIDTFQQGKQLQQYMLPNEASAISLSTLSNGRFAATYTSANSQFSVCEFAATDTLLHWHSYTGSAISSAAG